VRPVRSLSSERRPALCCRSCRARAIWQAVDDDEWQAMAAAIRASKADCAGRLVGYQAVVDSFERLLFDRDPMGLNFETNKDEYRPEAETIALRFLEGYLPDDPVTVVYEEFKRWFGEGTCGSRDTYERVGVELWSIWTSMNTGGERAP
jgi:hypothetical protein